MVMSVLELRDIIIHFGVSRQSDFTLHRVFDCLDVFNGFVVDDIPDLIDDTIPGYTTDHLIARSLVDRFYPGFELQITRDLRNGRVNWSGTLEPCEYLFENSIHFSATIDLRELCVNEAMTIVQLVLELMQDEASNYPYADLVYLAA